jgi:hypothetical protein
MGQARQEIAGCWKRLYATLNVCDSRRGGMDRIALARTLMSSNQFEIDLMHLERIIPLLVHGNPLALAYWRRRVLSLSTQPGLLPGENRRVTRLLNVFDEVERALTAGNAAARRSPG